MDGLRLNLNLQNLSMISIAAKLWDSQDIKNSIRKNFFEWNRNLTDENWCQISKLVVQFANSIYLPASLLVLLKETILIIGRKIYDWIDYVTKILKVDFIYTQKIYFSFGAVDEIKIFDLYWRDLMAPGNSKSDYFRHSPLFSLACIYDCERFVKERKNEMLEELSEFYPQIKEEDEIYNIMSVSICLTAKKSIPENLASPQRMFELCLEEGFSKAARFYWEKLDDVEKVSYLSDFPKKCWGKWNARFYNGRVCNGRFLNEKHCENLLFLINRMGEEERSLFFTDYADEIIKLFLPIWPYQELIVDLLKHDWNIGSSRSLEMVEFLISFNNRRNDLEFPMDNELVFQIMQKTWGNIRVYEKLAYLRNDDTVYSFILTLNQKILNFFFNDSSITEVDFRSRYMDNKIKEGFLVLVKRGKFDFLTSIIETVFNFIPEPKEALKPNLTDPRFVHELIMNDKSLRLVNQFLDWSAESETERARLKSKINTFSVCRYFMQRPYKSANFELADKFLNWRLESAAEVKSFKEEMKSSNFVIVGKSGYVRIKSGDLSWFRPGDFLVMHSDEDPYDNADGLTFLKFEGATELIRGVALGIKSCGSDENYDFLKRDCNHPDRWRVNYVGTKVGDFVVFNVREIWTHTNNSYFNLDVIFELSNSFIKFYYETEEEVLKFKKTKLPVLLTENVLQFVLDALKGYRNVLVSFLNLFCEFCMIPSEKIEEIKTQQRSEIGKFLDTYLIDQRNYNLVAIYLNWLFEEAKRTEVCRKFLNLSNKGALLCLSYLKNPRACGLSGEREFTVIRRWLSLVDDLEKLKKDVYALTENTQLRPKWLPELLDLAAHYYVIAIV